ncbi:MAG: hypothetical protein K2K79_06455 [Paramuribaculum sp.]|nr:hypothetical protein [Paramuribaculum sp.]
METITRILIERGYPEKIACQTAERLERMAPELKEALAVWLENEECPIVGAEGYTTADLMKRTPGMTYPAALLTLDWLKREPEKVNVEENAEYVFQMWLNYMGDACIDVLKTEELRTQIISLGDQYQYSSPATASKFYFMASLCYLLYAKGYYSSRDVTDELINASTYIDKAIKLYYSGEYYVLQRSICALTSSTPEICIYEGLLSKYEIEEYCSGDALFKSEWILSIYEECRYLSILKATDIVNDLYEEDDALGAELSIKLWEIASKMQNINYKLVANFYLYLFYFEDKTSSGKLSTRCCKCLNDAYYTEGYSIDSVDVNNAYDETWLGVYVYFAESLIDGTNIYEPKDVKKGLKMLRRVAMMDECTAQEEACSILSVMLDEACADEFKTEELCVQINSLGDQYQYSSPATASKFYFMASLCYLLYAKNHCVSRDVTDELINASTYIDKAIKLYYSGEYHVLQRSICALTSSTPEICIYEGLLSKYEIEEYCSGDALFKSEWILSIYEECRYLSILKATDIVNDLYEEDDALGAELSIKLWEIASKMQNINYKLVANFYLYVFYIEDKTSSGKLSTRCCKCLNDAYYTEGYSIDSVDINNAYDETWLRVYVYFAESLIDGTNIYEPKDVKKGLKMLRRVAVMDECEAQEEACRILSEKA